MPSDAKAMRGALCKRYSIHTVSVEFLVFFHGGLTDVSCPFGHALPGVLLREPVACATRELIRMPFLRLL